MERILPVSYAAVFLWGIAVLLGLIGLGRLVARAVGGELAGKAGWGLHAVWGMAAYLFVGGLLALFGACGETAITLLIGCGLAAMIWTTVRGGWPSRASLAAFPWQAWPFVAVAALMYSGGLAWQSNINVCDDLPAYYHFCEKLLATGSFDEPFSWRRLASLGGHTLLQSTILAHASWASAQAFETALCPVILLSLVLGFRRGTLARAPLGLCVALLALTTPIIRENSTSHFTGIVLFLGLFATLDAAERVEAGRRRWLVAAGLVAAGLCSLRAPNVAAAGGTLGLFWLGSWLRDRRPAREAFTEAASWAAVLFAALVPWMIMGWRSNGSPLFPLFQGGNNLAFNPQGIDGPLYERLKLPLRTLLEPALLPWLLCLLAVPDWRRALAARAVAIAGVLTTLVLAYGLGLVPDATTILRYVQPLLLSAALAALLAAAVTPRRRRLVWLLGALVLVSSFRERTQYLWSYYVELGRSQRLFLPFGASNVAAYREAQALVPAGRRMLVASDYPFLFDHARNPIWIVDLPHAASPPPGWPYQKPSEETKHYLLGQGVEYFVFVDPAQSAALYLRAKWQAHAAGDIPLWKIEAPFFLDFFDTVERLAATETVVGRAGELTVLRFQP